MKIAQSIVVLVTILIISQTSLFSAAEDTFDADMAQLKSYCKTLKSIGDKYFTQFSSNDLQLSDSDDDSQVGQNDSPLLDHKTLKTFGHNLLVAVNDATKRQYPGFSFEYNPGEHAPLLYEHKPQRSLRTYCMALTNLSTQCHEILSKSHRNPDHLKEVTANLLTNVKTVTCSEFLNVQLQPALK